MTHAARNSFASPSVSLLALASSVIWASGTSVHADTITVCESGCDYDDIQMAEDCSICPEDCDVSELFECHCGDGLCQTGYGENCLNCVDCGDPNWTCGDGICDCLEATSSSCPEDCD